MDDQAEVPHYFLCPISLQIMKDPVTAATGITYDRESIEQWLRTAVESVCPVTKQPLSRDFDLTPNHTLRRLIQAWCVANARHGVDRIPTPKAPLDRANVSKILRGLSVPRLQGASLDQLLVLATSDDLVKDKKMLVDSGVAKAMISLIISCHKEGKFTGLDKALRILIMIWIPTVEVKCLVAENYDFVDSLTWVISQDNVTLRSIGVLVIKEVIKVANSSLFDRLKPEFFKEVVGIIRHKSTNAVIAIKAALQILMKVCDHGRNRYKIIEANAIFELIELELDQLGQDKPDTKKVTEIVFSLLAQLCSCADGRAQFLAHAGGIVVLSKRILRVSPTVDDRAIHLFALISKYSATNETLQEMLKVGAASKLCMVLQADSAKYLKDKVREILRTHYHVWNNSPCIQVYLFTRYPMVQFS